MLLVLMSIYTLSVIRDKQKLSDSAEGHEGSIHSSRMNAVPFLDCINFQGQGGNLWWERLWSLLGSCLSNWLWRPGRWAERSWVDAGGESVCLADCVSVCLVSIYLFTMWRLCVSLSKLNRLLKLTWHIHCDDLRGKPSLYVSCTLVSRMSFLQQSRNSRKGL